MSYDDETAFMSCEERNYARDRRVTAEYIAPPENGKFTWAICPLCSGHGKHVNPSIDASGLSAEDFAEDPDFAEEYFSGGYDVTCNQCQGRGSVVVLPRGAEPEEDDEGDDSYPPECSNPNGHSWVENEESGATYCEWCLADGDA